MKSIFQNSVEHASYVERKATNTTSATEQIQVIKAI